MRKHVHGRQGIEPVTRGFGDRIASLGTCAHKTGSVIGPYQRLTWAWYRGCHPGLISYLRIMHFGSGCPSVRHGLWSVKGYAQRFAHPLSANDDTSSWREPTAPPPRPLGTRRSFGTRGAASERSVRRHSTVRSRKGMRRVCAEGSVTFATLSGRLRPRITVYRNSRRTRSTLARCCV